MRWPALLVAASLLVPAAAASAARPQSAFFNSIIPSRVDHLIGFTPTTFAIHPAGQRVVPITVRVGGRRYRYIFDNAAAAVGPSANIYVRNMLRARRYPSPEGIFLDRTLKGKEKRYLQVRLDLARDADVLVAARDHPACATGVSRAVAHGIAAGAIRTWSAAGVPAPPSGDSIALRRASTTGGRFGEPRFGAGTKLPTGAKAAFDGGLSEAASGDTAIAAVTSWSRARRYPNEHLRHPGRWRGTHRRLGPSAVAPERIPDLVRDAEASHGRPADRRRLREVPRGTARCGVVPQPRHAPRQGRVAGVRRRRSSSRPPADAPPHSGAWSSPFC